TATPQAGLNRTPSSTTTQAAGGTATLRDTASIRTEGTTTAGRTPMTSAGPDEETATAGRRRMRKD
ncbi:MAG TPA: hypothetical protein VNL91_01555, partial [Thermoanaerobaculia bacterium]|nr:hypothetical protein [Thermoanaerobaculia bacterium]